MRKALLVCHAPQDECVGIENASAIFTAARHPKSFLSLDTVDHLLRKRADGTYVAEVIATWASRYLPVGGPASALPEGVVEVSETRGGRFQQRVRTGGHLLVEDEPVAAGGELSRRRIHAEDCADCDTKDGDIGEITRSITIEGDARSRASEADGIGRSLPGPSYPRARDQDTVTSGVVTGAASRGSQLPRTERISWLK